MTTTARASVQHEDEQVRVTRWDFEPGESTGGTSTRTTTSWSP